MLLKMWVKGIFLSKCNYGVLTVSGSNCPTFNQNCFPLRAMGDVLKGSGFITTLFYKCCHPDMSGGTMIIHSHEVQGQVQLSY